MTRVKRSSACVSDISYEQHLDADRWATMQLLLNLLQRQEDHSKQLLIKYGYDHSLYLHITARKPKHIGMPLMLARSCLLALSARLKLAGP